MSHIALHKYKVPEQRPGSRLLETLLGNPTEEKPDVIAIAPDLTIMTRWMSMQNFTLADGEYLYLAVIPTYEELKSDIDKQVEEGIQTVQEAARNRIDQYRSEIEPKMVSVTTQ